MVPWEQHDAIWIHSCPEVKICNHILPIVAREAVQPRHRVPIAPAPRWVLGESRRPICWAPCSGRQWCLGEGPHCAWGETRRVAGTFGLFNVALDHMQSVVVKGGRQGEDRSVRRGMRGGGICEDD